MDLLLAFSCYASDLSTANLLPQKGRQQPDVAKFASCSFTKAANISAEADTATGY